MQTVKPWGGIGNVYLIDPNGFVARKWESLTTRMGVLDVAFELPRWPMIGFWTIRVTAQGTDL